MGILTLDKVMDIFGISRSTAWRWVQQGYLEQRKLGCSRKVYITEASVNRLIETGGGIA
jgi:predicted DNA-binding transcriptional regulator AlpA